MMKFLAYVLINGFEILLKMLPFSCKTGLIKLGNPDRSSPVFVTCNYHLTVSRVKRALKGQNAYLVVANSRGVNVWCAAAGGLFTHHDVISALVTCGVEDLVDHRRVVLPQLAAPGVEASVIRKKTGWKVAWGPVYARHIPEYLQENFTKTPLMHQVVFPWTQRIESAVFWAFPMSIIAAITILFFDLLVFFKVLGLIWLLAMILLLGFPLYHRILNRNLRIKNRVSVSFGLGGIQLLLWSFFLLTYYLSSIWLHTFHWELMAKWGAIALVVIVGLTFDLKGFTPIYKGDLLEDKQYLVVLDSEKCKGLGWCDQVCPRGCFQMDQTAGKATISTAENCVRCGACIVQCTRDALYFKNPKGEIIPPDVTRKFKLNLMGKRFSKDPTTAV